MAGCSGTSELAVSSRVGTVLLTLVDEVTDIFAEPLARQVTAAGKWTMYVAMDGSSCPARRTSVELGLPAEFFHESRPAVFDVCVLPMYRPNSLPLRSRTSKHQLRAPCIISSFFKIHHLPDANYHAASGGCWY